MIFEEVWAENNFFQINSLPSRRCTCNDCKMSQLILKFAGLSSKILECVDKMCPWCLSKQTTGGSVGHVFFRRDVFLFFQEFLFPWTVLVIQLRSNTLQKNCQKTNRACLSLPKVLFCITQAKPYQIILTLKVFVFFSNRIHLVSSEYVQN